MKGVGEEILDFEVIGVKPKFNEHEENGVSAFETLTRDSFPEKWKVIYFPVWLCDLLNITKRPSQNL